MRFLLILIVSFLFSLNVSASKVECPENLDFQNYYFVFEGADGYCPKSVESWKTNILHKADKKEDKKKNCLLAEGLHFHFLSLEKPISKNILYYSWSQVHSAFQCAKALKEKSVESGKNLQISVMGFSFGGFSAIRFTNKLVKEEFPPKRLFTIDPVAYNLKVFKSLFGNRNPIYDKSFEDVEWDNIFQNQDRASFKITGIDGMSTPSATHNEKIIISEDVFKDRFKGKVAGHMHITTSPEVLEVMKDFFSL